MTFEIVESEAATSDMELDAVERSLGFSFPHEYRSFLKRWNGGRPVPKVFSFTENGNVTQGAVAWFFAVYDGKYENFEKTYRVFKITKRRILDNLIPIARDGFGNLICISMAGDDRGSIIFWDHEKEDDEPTYENCSLIAPSLDAFLDGLYHVPPPNKDG